MADIISKCLGHRCVLPKGIVGLKWMEPLDASSVPPANRLV